MSSFPNPLGDSSQKSPVNSHDEFFVILMMALPITLGVFITLILTNTREVPEHSRTRQVTLDVPSDAQMNAEIIRKNDRIHLKNL